MKKIIWIERNMVINPYYVGLCFSEKAFKKELKKMDVPRQDWPDWVTKGKDATVHEFHRPDNGADVCVVCMTKDKKRTRAEAVGLIVHEAVHIWQKILSNLREHSPSIEFEAHSIQQIAQSLFVAYYK